MVRKLTLITEKKNLAIGQTNNLTATANGLDQIEQYIKAFSKMINSMALAQKHKMAKQELEFTKTTD